MEVGDSGREQMVEQEHNQKFGDGGQMEVEQEPYQLLKTDRKKHKGKLTRHRTASTSSEECCSNAYTPTVSRQATHTVHINPAGHILHDRSTKPIVGYGNHILCAEWYEDLPKIVKRTIKLAGFGSFMKVLRRWRCFGTTANYDILRVLAERWWDSTHTFHFDNVGELTMTPKDFAAIVGVPVCGLQLEYDELFSTNKELICEYYGEAMTTIINDVGKVPFGLIRDAYKDWPSTDRTHSEQLTRAFILCLLGSTLLCDKTSSVVLSYSPSLRHIERISKYNWGGAALCSMYRDMDNVCRGCKRIGSYWRAWEIWAYEYIKPIGELIPTGHPTSFPSALRWIRAGEAHQRWDLQQLRIMLRDLRPNEVEWNPWRYYQPSKHPYIKKSWPTTGQRVLLAGPHGYAWYLGERAQIFSCVLHRVCPKPPPRTSVVLDHSLSATEVVEGIKGWSILNLWDYSGNYDLFVEKFIKYTFYPSEITGGPVEIVGIPRMPSWIVKCAEWNVLDAKAVRMVNIPHNIPSPLYPLPLEAKYVRAADVNRLLEWDAGATSLLYNLSVECRDHINKLTPQWYEECSTERATTPGLQRKPHTIADVVGDHVIEEGARCNEKVTNSIGLSSWMTDGPVEIVGIPCMPSWIIESAEWNESEFNVSGMDKTVNIPHNIPSPLYPLPPEVKYVYAADVNRLLEWAAGATSLLCNLSVKCREHIKRATRPGIPRKLHGDDYVMEEGARCNEKVNNSIKSDRQPGTSLPTQLKQFPFRSLTSSLFRRKVG